jgi:hypothetical protein
MIKQDLEQSRRQASPQKVLPATPT